MTKIIFWLQVI